MIVGRAGGSRIWDAAEFEAFERGESDPEKLLASLEHWIMTEFHHVSVLLEGMH